MVSSIDLLLVAKIVMKSVLSLVGLKIMSGYELLFVEQVFLMK